MLSCREWRWWSIRVKELIMLVTYFSCINRQIRNMSVIEYLDVHHRAPSDNLGRSLLGFRTRVSGIFGFSASVKVVLKRYRIRRASASACTLCPFPEYSPLFQNTILIVSEDLDGYCSVSEGPDDYHMVSGCRDKYRIPIRR